MILSANPKLFAWDTITSYSSICLVSKQPHTSPPLKSPGKHIPDNELLVQVLGKHETAQGTSTDWKRMPQEQAQVSTEPVLKVSACFLALL